MLAKMLRAFKQTAREIWHFGMFFTCQNAKILFFFRHKARGFLLLVQKARKLLGGIFDLLPDSVSQTESAEIRVFWLGWKRSSCPLMERLKLKAPKSLFCWVGKGRVAP